MAISRRQFIVAGAAAPLLASCATDLSRFSDEPLPSLAERLGVCDATYSEFVPGERWQYSGEGYALLQTVICAVTGACPLHYSGGARRFSFFYAGLRVPRSILRARMIDVVVRSTPSRAPI